MRRLQGAEEMRRSVDRAVVETGILRQNRKQVVSRGACFTNWASPVFSQALALGSPEAELSGAYRFSVGPILRRSYCLRRLIG